MCISSRDSSRLFPEPSFSPRVRFLLRGLVAVTYRSPIPAGPNAVSGSAPIFSRSPIPSLYPERTRAALRLSPPIVSLSPSTSPHASATQFLYAPHSSAPVGSSAGVRISESVERRSAILSAIRMSWQATRAFVITPRATSGAMVGPVITTTWFDNPASDSLLSIASEIIPEPPSSDGARPFARSTSRWEGLRLGMSMSTTSSMAELGRARTRISQLSVTSEISIVQSISGISCPGRYFLFS